MGGAKGGGIVRQAHYEKLLILVLILLAGGVAYAKRAEIKDWMAESQKPDVEEVSFEDVTDDADDAADEPVDVIAEEPAEPDPTPADTTTNNPSPSTTLPATFNLAVPFTSQAPRATGTKSIRRPAKRHRS